jgi:hypothetical protein
MKYEEERMIGEFEWRLRDLRGKALCNTVEVWGGRVYSSELQEARIRLVNHLVPGNGEVACLCN